MVITYKPSNDPAGIVNFLTEDLCKYKGCLGFAVQYNAATTDYTVTATFCESTINNHYLPNLCQGQDITRIDSIVFNT